MMRLLPLLLVLPGCAFFPGAGGRNETGRGFIEGAVDRDGEPVNVKLFKSEFESCCDEYEVQPNGEGFVHTPDGKLLVYFELQWTGWAYAADDGAAEIPIGNWGDFGMEDYGATVSWIEQQRGFEPGVDTPIFRQTADDGSGTAEGTVTLIDTDWETFVEAHVQATLDNETYGKRKLDLSFRWEDTGNPD
jgi:hypothetical protein